MNQDTPRQAFALPVLAPQASPQHNHSATSVGDTLRLFRRHRIGLICWLALFIGAALVYLVVTPPEFVASTLIILDPHQATTREVDPENARPPTLDAAQADSQIQVVKSERLLRFVFETLDLKNTPEFANPAPGLMQRVLTLLHVSAAPRQDDDVDAALLRFMNAVSVRRIGQSYVLEVSYAALKPDIAASRANSIAAAYIWDQIEIRAAAAAHGTEFLQTRITDITAEAATALTAVKDGKIPAMRFPDSDARVISAAIEPKKQAFPQHGLVLAFAGTLGLLTGLALIVVRHSLDHTLRSRHQVMRDVGIGCLTTVPRVPASEKANLLDLRRSRWREQGLFRDALRCIRTAVMGSNPNLRHRSIGVMSWHAGEGKSTIAAHLAHVMAASGDRVALVDCDFRSAALTAALAPDEASGLNEHLLRQSAADLPPIVCLFGKLDFLPAAGADAYRDPNVFLGSAQMRQLLHDLQGEYSVIVDLPAMSVSSDALAIAPLLDGIILVVETCRTTVADVTGAVSALSATANVIGIVLNKDRLQGA